MKPEDIHITDWMRILMGELPVDYFFEILLRMAFTYLLLMVSMRFMGRRMASQMNRNEMAALTSLAAAIGMPVLSPDRGLLPAVAIAIIIVLGQRLIARIASRNERFEAITQDEIDILVQNGILNLEQMRRSRITRERLFAQLRSEGLLHLGQVRRLYLEANGKFTLIKEEPPIPGLSVIPNWDKKLVDEQKKSEDIMVCKNCGNHMPEKSTTEDKCPQCGDQNWLPPIETEE
ncbi:MULTISPECIES: YetF domain-containing protein [unclassified Siphonobacter]|uniref:YetF domain-containing protein n=1 Tax=unclassified Siphonobacter TaxID=2635712 RepID=UPI000CC4FEEE|nr:MULTISPECIES: YetF domain-containing protein [unclassified Siphonobacter]MDQ1090308.1 uncharacterized membrane protein YcaP (DUF421 family) [Siphonobacter sp. SORGH_AS_1065]MDR6198031.1 uncharacterized membrane protein YcaP (DUF421 family) [Siphonobacter sp. SORGH_AS_0500]PKK37092.1 hypothetical protein BWI96_06930 [Siphonobacter sp. SORGH_AS_0500]